MRRTGIALAIVVVVLGGLAYGGVLLYRSYSSHLSVGCRFGAFTTDNGQAAVASIMVGEVVSRELPERAAVLALAAGLQESKLRNIPSGQGDRDSVGVLQQRPSQGWGTVEQLSDVKFATGAFLDKLVQDPQWQTLPLAEAIQNVQISADGSAYAKHEARAQAIADALTGKTDRGVSCEFDEPTKVATASTVVAALKSALPVNEPTVQDKRITVSGASWATAAWFIANADRYGLSRVTYSGGRWERTHGWVDDSKAGGGEVVAELS